MHPAYSVIIFTTASGAGYGLLFLLGVFGSIGLLPPDRWFGLLAFGISLGLITAGLLSSMLHLGHPERAWRAFSQWRSSWLSREGVAAVLTYMPAGVYAIGWVFLETNTGAWAIAGWASAVCALITVYCTAMIYGSLRTIRQWYDKWVPPVYLALALATGAVLLVALMIIFGIFASWAAWLAAAACLLALLLKLAYWGSIEAKPPLYTAESATGLGRFGKVRQIEAPHTGANFVQREMGYQIARKHAMRLRTIIMLSLAAPIVLMGLAAISPVMILSAMLTKLAVASLGVGVVVERWLFFAEAEHVVNIYYGAEAA